MAVFSTILAAAAAIATGTADEAPQRASPEPQPFVILYEAGPAWRTGLPMREQDLRAHFYYVRALDEAGKVSAAGALGADGGLIVLQPTTAAEAARIMREDPAVSAGVFVGRVAPFSPRFVGETPLNPLVP